MGKKSKGYLPPKIGENRPIIVVNEEKGTLIQKVGFTENKKHALELTEGLFLRQSGLLLIEPECFLEKHCCEYHGVYQTFQSLNLFSIGVKNLSSPLSSNKLLFQKEKSSERVANSSTTSKLLFAKPDECFFSWFKSHMNDLSQNNDCIFTCLQIPQSFAYFQILRFEIPNL